MTDVAESIQHEENKINPSDALVPELTLEEEAILKKEKEDMKEEKTEEESEFKISDTPCADRVKELKMLAALDEDPEFYADLAKKDANEIYRNMKNMPDSVVKKYLPDLTRRFVELEKRCKSVENAVWAIPRTERSLEEDRFDILQELRDKTYQGFEIWDEHLDRNLKFGHRAVLECRLLVLLHSKLDIIDKVLGEFDKLKDDRDGVNNERDWLRYEIRHSDLNYCEIHECFLKSYLGMDW